MCRRRGDGHPAIAHWTSAGDSARQAAQAVLGLDPPGLEDDGYFWSDQYDLRVQFAGRTTPDSTVPW